MLISVSSTIVHVFEDAELDLLFTWNDCCPIITVTRLGDCAQVPIDQIMLDLDPAVDQWIQTDDCAYVKSFILKYIETKKKYI